MTKPPLGKVEALLYVLQHVTKRGCARIMTHPLFIMGWERGLPHAHLEGLLAYRHDVDAG